MRHTVASGVASRRRTLDPELTILGGRDFVGLVGRLCREQNWEALIARFRRGRRPRAGVAYVSLTDLDTATRVLADAARGLSAPRGKRQAPTQNQPADEDAEDELAARPHRGRGGAARRAAAGRR